MLGQRRGRWANIKQTLVQHFVTAEFSFIQHSISGKMEFELHTCCIFCIHSKHHVVKPSHKMWQHCAYKFMCTLVGLHETLSRVGSMFYNFFWLDQGK